MNTKVERIENNVVKIEVTVPVENFKEALKKSYEKNVSRFSVPGFRKGKAPMAIIEKFYGEGVFYEDAINFIVEETYPKAVEENDIHPVDYPELDIVQIGKDVDFIYTARVTVKPEVKLGQYKGLEATKISYLVTDEDVEAEINMLKEKNARIINKENGTIEKGDIAVIDFEGFIDNTPFEGGKAENYELVIGSGTFIPGFEDQLVGAKVGETVDVNVTFPEDYHAENLKGKPALFKVTIKDIKVKEYPVVDDEFAKDVSEFETLEELKADIRKRIQEENDKRAKMELEDQLIGKVVNASEVEIPEAMINQEIDYMVKDMDYRLRYQGLNIDQYIEMMGITMETLRNDLKEVATNRVKTSLVLEAIAKAENITATEEEIESRAEELAKRYGVKDIERMKKAILDSQRALIAEEIVNNKVIDFVVSESKIIG
ncbi:MULTISPECIES: trigger factor [Caloramator]|uniref:Trigger factor n=1 Tax=Caloramator australicus RC3 TaxID=857293 RepID=I7LHA2_9CLOT|nr:MULTISPECIES: trigger factor [Caloramator]MDO6355178.1 trigger factor [Caloramator sp. CAR-1]CCJ33881.1 Cell division trigger factor [Caloramator australicus RC3]